MVRTATREPVIYGTAWTRIKDSMALVEIRALRLENRIAAPVQEQRRGRVSSPDFVSVEPRRGPMEVHAKLAIVVVADLPLPRVACVGAAILARNAHWDLIAAPPSRGKITNGNTPHYTRHRGS